MAQISVGAVNASMNFIRELPSFLRESQVNPALPGVRTLQGRPAVAPHLEYSHLPYHNAHHMADTDFAADWILKQELREGTNLAHVLLSVVDHNKPMLQAILGWSAFYHDAVYVPGFEYNEQASACQLRQDFNRICATEHSAPGGKFLSAFRDLACALVEHTTFQHHSDYTLTKVSFEDPRSFNPSEVIKDDKGARARAHAVFASLLAILLDADLNSLAVPYDQFVVNQRHIRLEQGVRPCSLDNKLVLQAQARWLRATFIEGRENVYRTNAHRTRDRLGDFFGVNAEVAARQNILQFHKEAFASDDAL